MNNKKALIVFFKRPELGKVKTRLAGETSNNFALKFYSLVLWEIFGVLTRLSEEIDLFIYGSDENGKDDASKMITREFFFRNQIGNDLGEKISNAFCEVFDEKYKRVIIIGTDIPDLSVNIINKAFSLLEVNDVVISPSDDGGYSLLGMNGFHSDLFKNIEWSTNKVFDATKKIIQQNKLTFAETEMLPDIDTLSELRYWMSKANQNSLVNKIKNIAENESVVL